MMIFRWQLFYEGSVRMRGHLDGSFRREAEDMRIFQSQFFREAEDMRIFRWQF